MTTTIITVSTRGDAEVKVTGHPGPGCREASKWLEGLGLVVSDTNTGEYYEPKEQTWIREQSSQR